MWVLDYYLSVAVGVGFIALAEVAAETGVIMLVYLRHAMQDLDDAAGSEGVPSAVLRGASERVRPLIMTVCAIIFDHVDLGLR